MSQLNDDNEEGKSATVTPIPTAPGTLPDRIIPLSKTNCNEFLSRKGIKLGDGKKVGTVKPESYFEIEFDIVINSKCNNPSGNWGYDAICSVLSIGDRSNYWSRYPLLFTANRDQGMNDNKWYTRLTVAPTDTPICCGKQINFIEQEDRALAEIGVTHRVYVALRPDGYTVIIDGKEKILFENIDRYIPDRKFPLFLSTPFERAADATNLCIRSSAKSNYGESRRQIIIPDQDPVGVTTLFQEGYTNSIKRTNGVKRWVVKGDFVRESNGGNNWPLSINLPGDKYGFETGRDNSQFSITMRAQCQTDNNLWSTPECDGFFVIGFGDNQYVTFGTDFDGLLGTNGKVGLVTYPACGGDVATGNAANLLNFNNWRVTRDNFLGAIAGGNSRNLKLLSARGQSNGENFPITIEITNNDVAGTMQFRFASPAFPNGLTCDYNSVNTNEDINVYFSPDFSTPTRPESIAIRSFVLYGNKYRSANEYSMAYYPDESLIEDEFDGYQRDIAKDKLESGSMFVNHDKFEMRSLDVIADKYGFITVGLIAIFGIIMMVIALCRYLMKKNVEQKLSTETDPLLAINVQAKH